MFYMNVEECWVLRRATLLVRAYDAVKRYHVLACAERLRFLGIDPVDYRINETSII